MAKIKGWKKIGADVWKNEKSGVVLKVEGYRDIGGYFTSIKISPDLPPVEFHEITQGESWSRRSDVVKEAVKFMKKNPVFPVQG